MRMYTVGGSFLTLSHGMLSSQLQFQVCMHEFTLVFQQNMCVMFMVFAAICKLSVMAGGSDSFLCDQTDALQIADDPSVKCIIYGNLKFIPCKLYRFVNSLPCRSCEYLSDPSNICMVDILCLQYVLGDKQPNESSMFLYQSSTNSLDTVGYWLAFASCSSSYWAVGRWQVRC